MRSRTAWAHGPQGPLLVVHVAVRWNLVLGAARPENQVAGVITRSRATRLGGPRHAIARRREADEGRLIRVVDVEDDPPRRIQGAVHGVHVRTRPVRVQREGAARVLQTSFRGLLAGRAVHYRQARHGSAGVRDLKLDDGLRGPGPQIAADPAP